MKTLYFECKMGAAGDMLMSALLELVPDKDEFINRLNNVGIPNVKIEAEEILKCGISGTHTRVFVSGKEEHEHMHDHAHEHKHDHDHDHKHDHEHSHEHSHNHHHVHSGLNEICNLIRSLNISEKVKEDATAVYKILGKAECHAHNKDMENIHFHEVGTMDAVADIVGVCMLIDELSPSKIISSPIHVGSGFVRCAHGILPVPAPATAYILRDVPTYGGKIDGELCTPTGAALLKYFTDEFVEEYSISVKNIGYGMGSREFKSPDGIPILSAVRAMISDCEDLTDSVIELSCNIDDMTGEQIGYATQMILDGGALDVYTVHIQMKKNRPGILLNCICDESQREKMAKLIFKHTTTIGIRENSMKRFKLKRNEYEKNTKYGSIKIKKSEGYGTIKEKPEYEDLVEIAKREDVSIFDLEI